MQKAAELGETQNAPLTMAEQRIAVEPLLRGTYVKQNAELEQILLIEDATLGMCGKVTSF